MGVDFYACENCGDTFPDCGDYVGCECGQHWCSDECAEVDGFRNEDDGFTPKGSKWTQESSCKYCRQDDFQDWELLDVALRLLNKTRQDLIEIRKSETK